METCAFEQNLVTQTNDCQHGTVQTNNELLQLMSPICKESRPYGIYSSNQLHRGNFPYMRECDPIRHDTCGFEAYGYTQGMHSFCVHCQLSSNHLFVRTRQLKDKMRENCRESPFKRRKLELNIDQTSRTKSGFELNILKQVRQRTFSHWPPEKLSLKQSLMMAGFFQCNVSDRVICIYCNLICQEWKENVDDPIEVHRTLSPKCSYVLFMLRSDVNVSSTFIANKTPIDDKNKHADTSDNSSQVHSDQIMHSSPHNANYMSISSRHASYETWNHESSPSVDELAQAGFFYTGIKNIVRCFYCNGSLQSWRKHDNPLIEHIKFFPHCAYAKQLAGDDLYVKVRRKLAGSEIGETFLAETIIA